MQRRQSYWLDEERMQMDRQMDRYFFSFIRTNIGGFNIWRFVEVWIWQDFNLAKSHCHNNYKLVLYVLRLKDINTNWLQLANIVLAKP